MKYIKPARLNKGDTIGLVSPSSPMAGLVPHRTERAIAMLNELGFKTRVGKNALKAGDYTAGTPEERAHDLHELFSEDSVRAIICFIGGNHSNQLLPYLDFHLIKKHPKIFIGYSDATVLHFAFLTVAGIVSFYGPSALVQFAENPRMLSYTQDYFTKALMQIEPIGTIAPSDEWTEETLNWFHKKDLERPRSLKKNNGWRWEQKGAAEGVLIGGCLSSMMHVKGTRYWPDFKDAILFYETSEREGDFSRGEKLAQIESELADLNNIGLFRQIRGLVVGRPFGFTDDEREKFRKLITAYTKGYPYPVLLDADIGHTDPMITIPLGVRARLDSNSNSFEILESGVL